MVLDIDLTSVTGPAGRYVYFNLQDAESGSSLKHLGISVRLQNAGSGGPALLQCYQNFTSEGLSSHGFNAGELTEGDLDLRFDFTKASAGAVWSVTPYYRLSGGSWTPFYGGAFTGTVAFDYIGAKFAAVFDGGADGTVSFSNYYLAGPPSKTYVDDDWTGYAAGTPVQFPGETEYRTFSVDAFSSVQTGVNAATSGGTVNVAAGTYGENVTVSKALALRGAQAGVDARGRSASESVITAGTGNVCYVNAGNVTIDGFQFNGTGAGKLVSVDGGTNFDFRNNLLNGTAGSGLYFGSTSSTVTIQGNKFAGSPFSGYTLYFDGGGDVFNTLTVSENDFYGGSVFAGAKTFNSSGMNMSGNLFDGAVVNLSSAFTNSTVYNNTFRNNAYTNAQLGLKNSTVGCNTFDNTGPSPSPGYPSYALMLWGNQYSLTPSQNVTVSNNVFRYNGYAAPNELAHGLRILSGIDASTITVYGNSFINGAQQSGAIAVVNQATTGTADASANWWGSNDKDAVRTAANGGANVDYTPWLHVETDASGDPGFQGDFSTLDVDDDSPQTGALDRVREAVGLASGSTVNLMPGTYTNTAQVVIGKNLALAGAGSGSTTINKSFDTGNSGDGRAWFLVQDGYDFDLSGVTLDGTGYRTFQGIRNKGAGSVDDVVFDEIKYNPSGPDYAGIAIAAFGTGAVDVTNSVFTEIGRVGVLYFGAGVSGSVFHNNAYTGKGAGNWLDYALDISAGAVVSVDGCTITGCRGVASSDGSTSAAIMATTFYGAGTAATITHCDLTNNTTGIEVGYNASDASTVEAHYNAIYGNDWGVSSTNPTVDALSNWWGHATGPYHASLNPGGLGNKVSDHVLFDPWLGGMHEISVVPSYELSNCTTPVEYTFHIEQLVMPQQVRGYDVKFDVDDYVVTVATPSTDIVEGDYLKDVGSTSFYRIDNGGGTYTVSCAILGGDMGATGRGDLFTVKLTPSHEGTSPISMVTLKLRDLDNQPLAVSGVDGSVEIDCTVPVMQAIVELENECYNQAPTFSVFTFRDAVGLDLAEYQIDTDGWNAIFTGLSFPDTVWSDPDWELPGFGGSGSGLSEGPHTVYFRVKDDAGNWNGEGTPATYSWSFIKDTVAPAAPTGFVALPGHDKVHLTWTNPTGDASWVGVEIRRVGWTDYPEYGTGPVTVVPEPAYPADETEGTQVAQTSLAAHDDLVTPRDIYYYAAFSYDCAGNYSAATDGSRDRSTSYWLGDMIPTMTGDGTIALGDLTAFGVTFGVSEGGTNWNAEGDFGPTDDWSRFGIPEPDDVVDFEDLMIMAMNFGKVSPLGSSGLGVLASSTVPLREQVAFRLVLLSREGDRATYGVEMENGSAVLKGFALKLFYGAGNELLEVKASSKLVGKGDEHFFGTIERETGVVEVCVAALGVDVPMGYTGEVARLVVREANVPGARISSVDLRDIANRRDEVTVPGGGGETSYIPAVSSLGQNHPNPFNPVTSIAYEVATAGPVTIDIYDVSGHLVRRLVDEQRGVGRHTATWDGRDGAGNGVHSGVYFYRMSAPGYTSPAKKMLLLK